MMDNKTRILVVDDAPFCIWTIRDKLEHGGYDVHMMSNGESVTELVKSWEPALVILGCCLPHLNGYKICERVREFSMVPIIMLFSDLDPEADKIKGLKLGADDYVTKPFDADELVARVRALLRRVEFSKQKVLW
jgi:DNA-binding response OmpR family regulator